MRYKHYALHLTHIITLYLVKHKSAKFLHNA